MITSDPSKLVSAPMSNSYFQLLTSKLLELLLPLFPSHPHPICQETLLVLTSKYMHNLITTMNLIQTIIICLDSCKGHLTYLLAFTHPLTVYSQHNSQRFIFLKPKSEKIIFLLKTFQCHSILISYGTFSDLLWNHFLFSSL